MSTFDYGLAPLPGGFSGETFLAEAGGERTVVRIYAARGLERGPAAVEIDAALLRLVRGLVPVPQVLEVRRADPASGTPAVLVTGYLPGERLDTLLPRLDDDTPATVGTNLGVLLGRLAQMPTLRAGVFVDAELRIRPHGEGDLVDFVRACREHGAIADWDDQAYDRLLDLADRAQSLIVDIGRTCLVHSDFNPKNLLVEPETGQVTGVLDWEFAHSGAPGTDLGNLLRFERDPVLTRAVLRAYADTVPDVPEDLLTVARALDLYALVDLASRRGSNPVADRAHGLLASMAATGDLHASPPLS